MLPAAANFVPVSNCFMPLQSMKYDDFSHWSYMLTHTLRRFSNRRFFF